MEPLLLILKRLVDHDVEFVVIGGMAAIAHGADVVTQDVDVCIPFTEANCSKLIDALRDIRPTFRMRPDKLRMYDDPARLAKLKNLYVLTDLGVIDFLGEVSGIGFYADAINRSETVTLSLDLTCRMLDIDALIAAKRAAGRPKDIQAVHQLEVVRKLRQEKEPPTAPSE